MATTLSNVETEEILVSIPVDVLREIDRLAAEKGRTRSQVVTGAARGFVFAEERWRSLQAEASATVARSGLKEEEIADSLDSLDDQTA